MIIYTFLNSNDSTVAMTYTVGEIMDIVDNSENTPDDGTLFSYLKTFHAMKVVTEDCAPYEFKIFLTEEEAKSEYVQLLERASHFWKMVEGAKQQ